MTKGATSPKPWAAMALLVNSLHPRSSMLFQSPSPAPDDTLRLTSLFFAIVFQFSKRMCVRQKTGKETLWFVLGESENLPVSFVKLPRAELSPKTISARNHQGGRAQPSSCYNKSTKHRKTKTPRGSDAGIDDWFLFLLPPPLFFWLPTTQATSPGFLALEQDCELANLEKLSSAF